jgi:uncharacterized membrane protein
MSTVTVSQRIRTMLKIKDKDEKFISSMFANLQADIDAILMAFGFTYGLVIITIVSYIFPRYSTWNELGNFIGLYILANTILLIKFIWVRLNSQWTLDDLGRMLMELQERMER